jgi:hypothetical protein
MLGSRLALLMILLAAPAYAGSRVGGGFHGGGFHGGGFHGGFRGGGGFHDGGGGFHGDGGGFHGGRVAAFHRGGGRGLGFFGGYGYGYNCGFGSDCGVYDSGYGYGGGGAGNAVSSSSDGFTGGYVPDPEGADIPSVYFPSSCWVRRAAYDPSGAYVGQVLIDLCRHSDSVTVTGLEARAGTPKTGAGQPAPLYRSGEPQSPQ